MKAWSRLARTRNHSAVCSECSPHTGAGHERIRKAAWPRTKLGEVPQDKDNCVQRLLQALQHAAETQRSQHWREPATEVEERRVAEVGTCRQANTGLQRSRFWRPGAGRDIFRTGWSPSMPATPSHPLRPAGKGGNEVRLRCLRSQVPPATSVGHHCHPYIDRRAALTPEICREGGEEANYLGLLPAEPLRKQSFLAPIWSSSVLTAHGNNESCFIRCCDN